jgi:hypothetical protein
MKRGEAMIEKKQHNMDELNGESLNTLGVLKDQGCREHFKPRKT